MLIEMTSGSRKKDILKKEIRNRGGSSHTQVSNSNKNDKVSETGGKSKTTPKYEHSSLWTPGSYLAIKALLSARFCSAIWGLLNDCDETYNYWEPTHYLLTGKGFQTWEYSPEFALRSYLYVILHAFPAAIYNFFFPSNNMLLFFFIRCLLAILSTACEFYFYKGICKEFGANVGRIFLVMSVFAAGMFLSSTAYLPSTFSMYFTMLSYGAWFRNNKGLSILLTAASSFIGWPFAALLGLPIALDIVVRKKYFVLFLKWCFISVFLILTPLILLDSSFYGKFVCAPLNIVMYNIFTSHGPDLYGTEPMSFYFINGFLNFNFVFIFALFSLPIYAFPTVHKLKNKLPLWLVLSSFYLWFTIFTLQAHKEERFLFPVYPILILSASISVDLIQRVLFSICCSKSKKNYLYHTNWVSFVIVVVASILSLSRIVGQYQAFRGPFATFMELNRLQNEDAIPNFRSINVCLGREWYRYPSSFFLPRENWNVLFIESEFRGQLPKPYSSSSNGTLIIPTYMNDANLEETSRYSTLSQCHYLIDIDRIEETSREPRYSLKKEQWKIVHSIPYLESAKSHRLFRAFYIPFLTEKYCSYVDYVLLQSVKLFKKYS